MAFVGWKDEYSVKVTQMDDEHKKLFKGGYTGLAAQQAAHRAFTDKVKEYDARLQAGKLVLLFDVGNFTRTWLAEHIKAMDRQYSEVLAPTAK
ncbi:MAG TPA: hypothetical protein VMF68_00485 [Spirochaetia bacterium]|nr:hypothetical protein [Spirochaetia bacterium]